MLFRSNSKDAARLSELGTSCPDHFLRTKIKPLYVDWNPQAEDVAALKAKLTAALDAYRKDYAAYYAKCKHTNSPAMRDPNPTVVLIPGLGMALGEYFELDPLAEACARDRRWSFLFTSAPLNVFGGVGSPPNALALR